MILLVTYKIGSKNDYTSLYNAIKGGHATTWWHYLDHTWMVKTTEKPSEMVDRLRPHINEVSDSLFIVKIDPYEYNGWLPAKAYEWIRDNRE
jgi:hypothetical protein